MHSVSVSAARRRHVVTAMGAVAVAVALVTACSSSPASSNNSGSTAGASGSQVAASSSTRTLRVLMNNPPSGLDPVASSRQGEYVWGTMIEPVVSTGSDLQPVKTGIVTDWSRPTPTTWTLTVRPGIKFTNGEAADASAVAYSILQNRNNPGAILAGYFQNVKSAVATNPTTVTITTVKPQYDVIDLLTTVYLIPPKYYAAQGTKGFTAHPIGTGAFIWAGQQAATSISVTANPSYWGGKPKVAGITFTWSTDPAQRLALIQSGSEDISFDLPAAQAESARAAGLDVTSVHTAVKLTTFLEADKAPFTDANLREAAALAIDRNALVNSILSGAATPDGGLLNVLPGQKPAQLVAPDPAKAKSLVTGSPQIELSWPAGLYTNIDDLAQAIGGQLTAAGFKVKYNPISYAALVGLVLQRQVTGMYILAAVPNVAVPDFFAHGFMTSDSITRNCPSTQLDTMANQALETSGPQAAAAIYDQMNTLAVVDMHCYVPLYQETFNYATKNITGLQYNALNAVNYNTVGFTK